jgi:2-polyprenyl-6-methoxyphenol hydroxylase-like FAD-dependent oxidoreductase
MTACSDIAVVGAGTAGLATALALARAGHRVVLVERDPLDHTPAEAAFGWARRGIPHFLQPHALIPRGRKELRAHLPDVYAALLQAGANDVDLRAKLPGPAQSDDEELAYLGIRRPLIEWALREAVLAQPGIEVRDRTRVTGLVGHSGTLRGVKTEAGNLAADLVVDALGRTSPTPGWLESIGSAQPYTEMTECGVVYYCRYYRVLEGKTLPDGPWIPTPRAMLSYAAFSSFPGDNGTFGAVLAISPHDRELKMLRDERAFEAAVSTMPALHAWTSLSEPITSVLPMGSLQNTFRHYVRDGRNEARHFVPVGDALCHTNPMFALGLSQSIIHAFALASALDESEEVDAATAAYHSAVEPEALERYALVTAADDARRRVWHGESVDFAHRSGAYQLFVLAAGAAAALVDPDVFRAFVRRTGFLDRTDVLDNDVALQERIEAIFTSLRSKPAPPSGPAREQLLAVIAEATQAPAAAKA